MIYDGLSPEVQFAALELADLCRRWNDAPDDDPDVCEWLAETCSNMDADSARRMLFCAIIHMGTAA